MKITEPSRPELLLGRQTGNPRRRAEATFGATALVWLVTAGALTGAGIVLARWFPAPPPDL